MSDWNPPIRHRLAWALTYAFVAGGSGVLTAALVDFPMVLTGGAVYFSIDGFPGIVSYVLAYAVVHSPVAALEVLLFVYLYRRGSGSWWLWGLGLALPVTSELVWQAFAGSEWLEAAWAWLWLWRDPPEILLSLDLIFRNAFSNLVPPFLAGALVTWMARRQAARNISMPIEGA